MCQVSFLVVFFGYELCNQFIGVHENIQKLRMLRLLTTLRQNIISLKSRFRIHACVQSHHWQWIHVILWFVISHNRHYFSSLELFKKTCQYNDIFSTNYQHDVLLTSFIIPKENYNRNGYLIIYSFLNKILK